MLDPVALHVVVVLHSVVLHGVSVLVAKALLVDVLLKTLPIPVVSVRLLVPRCAGPCGLAWDLLARFVVKVRVLVLAPVV
eukprot:5330631-Pyramimonas_sp.AAC.1